MFCDVILGNCTRTYVKPIPVLTLGTFHFDFPNLDKIQYAKDEMIDVLEPRYQDEINKLVNALSEFAPTIIVIERPVKMQAEIDSLYKLYQEDKYFYIVESMSK